MKLNRSRQRQSCCLLNTILCREELASWWSLMVTQISASCKCQLGGGIQEEARELRERKGWDFQGRGVCLHQRNTDAKLLGCPMSYFFIYQSGETAKIMFRDAHCSGWGSNRQGSLQPERLLQWLSLLIALNLSISLHKIWIFPWSLNKEAERRPLGAATWEEPSLRTDAEEDPGRPASLVWLSM